MAELNADNRAEAAKAHFPYAYTPVAGIPRYARFRAEGLPPSACLWHGLSYLLKYKNKRRAAPQEEIDYFRRQHQLLRLLAAEPTQDGDAALALVGDLMWIRDGWSSFLADDVLDHLNRHPVVLGNLETVVSARHRVPRLLPDCIRFNSEPALLTSFRRPDGRNTFTALSLANNHILDFGAQGARETMTLLDHHGILHSGARDGQGGRPYVTFAAGGITFGFYTATSCLNRGAGAVTVHTVEGLAPEGEREPDLTEIAAVLAGMAAEGVDVRIVFLHWGFEYELYPSPRQVQVAREIVRAGADVIAGSHPHVQQPAEVCFVNGYEKRYAERATACPALRHPTGCIVDDETGRPRKAIILYSLGNFTTAMRTFLCRVGRIQSLRLRRDPGTGRVDWFAPRARLVYNTRKHPETAARRLVFLDTYLRALERKKPLPPTLRADLAFLADHVVADPLHTG